MVPGTVVTGRPEPPPLPKAKPAPWGTSGPWEDGAGIGRSVWPSGLAVDTWPVRVRAREQFFLRFLLPDFSKAWAGGRATGGHRRGGPRPGLGGEAAVWPRR